MFTYDDASGALFTCDSFGCHYADDRIFSDLIDRDLTPEYKYYFDNILAPYKNPHMLNALKKIEPLDVRFVGNGHGPVLRSGIHEMFETMRKWSTPPGGHF
jgi:flavorubredoxin